MYWHGLKSRYLMYDEPANFPLSVEGYQCYSVGRHTIFPVKYVTAMGGVHYHETILVRLDPLSLLIRFVLSFIKLATDHQFLRGVATDIST